MAPQLLSEPATARYGHSVLQSHGLPSDVDNHYEVKVNGAWISVPPQKIIRSAAPDLGFHVCAPFKFDGQPDHLYCVVIPPET
jgi:hypothetical protein